ncbi:barstar family protein [uncultured Lacinutrix sp.]|uniref:barstar family protein n=1 Tax=uncultured Lacinutrix sp. TaxID=574032 RepID=UPI002632F5F1|nr:barstar family protein [uncultured Lacinutrix sp.]
MKIGFGFDKYPEEYDYIATFKEVNGLEGENVIQKHLENENSIDYCELTLFRCSIGEKEFLNRFDKESKHYDYSAYIYILSSSGNILTSNFISGVEVSKIFKDNNNLNVTINGWLYPSSKGFYEIAKKRLNNDIKTFGTWKDLSPEKVQGWLDASIRLGTYSEDVSNKIVSINSNDIDCEDKFYCALGESINGIGGYFGRNLSALNDCFYGGFGIKENFTLKWLNHEIYKQKFPEHFKGILEIFSDNNKTLILE